MNKIVFLFRFVDDQSSDIQSLLPRKPVEYTDFCLEASPVPIVLPLQFLGYILVPHPI